VKFGKENIEKEGGDRFFNFLPKKFLIKFWGFKF